MELFVEEEMFMKNNYLLHHGVIGQKKGVRHGPPYPLTGDNLREAKQDYKSERKANHRGNSSSEDLSSFKKKSFNFVHVKSQKDRNGNSSKNDSDELVEKTRSESVEKVKSLAQQTKEMQEQINYINTKKQLDALLYPKPKKSVADKFVESVAKDVVAPAFKQVGREWLTKNLRETIVEKTK